MSRVAMRFAPEIAFAASSLIVALVVGQAIGVLETLRLVGTLLLFSTLPGVAIARHLVPRVGSLSTIILGTVLGLCLWALGGMASHLTDLWLARWIPIVAGLALWFIRPGPSADDARPEPRERTNPMLALSWVVGTLAMLPALRTAVLTQPTSWTGWHQFYVDLGFQIGITAEAGARAPQVFPFAPDLVLSYPWLFSSSMGVWSSASGVTAADIVLAAWPALFTVLAPALVGIVAYRLTRRTDVAVVAPLIVVFARGPVLLPSELQQIPLFSLSPARDFSTLVLVVVILSLAHIITRAAASWWWWGTLAGATFVATGSKASAMPVLLGGLLSALAILVVSRKFSIRHLSVAGVFGVSALSSFLLVLPDLGGSQELEIGPLSFLPPGTEDRLMWSVLIVAILLSSIVAVWLCIALTTGQWIEATLIAGTALAGLIGLATFTHAGYSQLYFWQSASPVFAIGVAWAACLVADRYGFRALIAFAVVLVGAQVLSQLMNRPSLVAVGALVLVSAVSIVLTRTRPSNGSWRTGVGAALVVAGVLIQATQYVGIPGGVTGGVQSSANDPTAVHETQLAALEFIHDSSAPSDLIVTNRHCRTGDLAAGDCDPRWYWVSALSERRVLVEGWGYTRAAASPDLVAWSLGRSEDFVLTPSKRGADELRQLGVRYVYVDTRFPYSPELEDVATPVFETEWALVFELR